jgi:uncharacterized membrane protein
VEWTTLDNPLNAPTSDDKLWAGLSYVGIICCMIPTVVIFFLKKDESAYLKFNSLQALGFGLATIVIGFALGIVVGLIGQAIPLLGLLAGLVPLVVQLGFLGYWIYLMIQAFTGKDVRIPILADFIDQNLMG